MSAGIIGIDFGTTNSLVAFMDGDRPSLIPNARGARSTPSAVALSSKGEILVGESAKNQAFINPGNTVLAIKRLLGGSVPVLMGQREYRPPEIVALILGALRADAERHLGRVVVKAVVTAPAHFSEPARRGLLEAGRLAGLEIVRLLNEPTAASLARAWLAAGKDGIEAAAARARLLLIYDFGGGTFDVTILRQEGRDCSVLASRGDGKLGGIDLDRELYQRAKRHFSEAYGLDVESDRLLAQQLTDQSERAKIELSERVETTLALPFAYRSVDGSLLHPEFTLGRVEFETLALPFIERSLELTVRALEDARVEAREIDSLILSGGSSRIPLVRRLIEERLGLRPSGGINPDEIVALGAAVEGALISGSERLTVRDVVSRSYGVEIDGGRFTPLIRKNSPVPATRQRMFTTVTDNQDSVEIHVLQGESTVISENLSLGRFLLAGLRPVTAGMPRIAVDFTIDESNILHVSARDLESGSIQAITIVDLDRGSSDESAEALAGKISGLRARLEELRSGATMEGSLDTEVRAAIEGGASAEPSLGVDKLRVLRAELEGLVGELLSRAVRVPRREAALREAPNPGVAADAAPVHIVQPAGKKRDRRRRDTRT